MCDFQTEVVWSCIYVFVEAMQCALVMATLSKVTSLVQLAHRHLLTSTV
jgi:hypothetical protein